MTSVSFHYFWALQGDTAFSNQLMFFNNIGIIGGLLGFIAFGASATNGGAKLGEECGNSLPSAAMDNVERDSLRQVAAPAARAGRPEERRTYACGDRRQYPGRGDRGALWLPNFRVRCLAAGGGMIHAF